MVLILIIKYPDSIEVRLVHHRKHRMDFSLAFKELAYPFPYLHPFIPLVIIPSCLIAFPYSFRQIAIKVHQFKSHRTVVAMFQILLPFDLLLELRTANYTSSTVEIQGAFEIRRLGLARRQVSIATTMR